MGWNTHMEKLVHDHKVLETDVLLRQVQCERERPPRRARAPLARHLLKTNDLGVDAQPHRPGESTPPKLLSWIHRRLHSEASGTRNAMASSTTLDRSSGASLSSG